MTVIGKPQYGSSTQFKPKKYFSLKDGESVYRILPPFGEEGSDPSTLVRWSKYYSVHFGYKDLEGKMKPFQSPEVKNNKTKMVEVPDAALDRIRFLQAQLKQAETDGNEDAVEKLKALVGFNGQFNLDKNHYMNVIDQQGNIGILKIRHTAKKLLDGEIARMEAEGKDPLSADDGRFFVFRRSGTNRETSYSVSILKEKLVVEGIGTVERDVVHKLTPDIISRLKGEAGDLEKLFRTPTSEEVSRMVKEGPAAVSEILSPKKKQETKTTTVAATTVVATEEDEDEGAEQDNSYRAPVSQATTQPTKTVAANTASLGTVGAVQDLAAPATKATTAKTKTVATKTTAAKLEATSVEDFLKQLEG